jgi:putative addiction module component (TIGR02574 family)
MNADLSELRKLPIDEKLRIVEILWEDIAAKSGEIELDDRHFTEAKRRSDQLKADPSKAITRDELWRQVDG